MIKGFPLTIILTIITIIFFVIDFYFMFRYDRERVEVGKGWSWDYTVFVFGLSFVMLLQPVLLPKLGWNTDSLFGIMLQIIGGLSVILSLTLHMWARSHLRHFYTERVEVQKNHQLINTGPYSFVRHPIITSFFLLSGGVLLINPAITTFLILIYTVVTFRKSSMEEEDLLSKSVVGYDDYVKQVPRFFPTLWKKQ